MEYKELFEFTKQERNGIIFFIITAFILVLAGAFWPEQKNVDAEIDLSQYYFPEDSLVVQDEEEFDINEEFYKTRPGKTVEQIRIKFNFNPNTISVDSLKLLGFSKFGANNLDKFRAKGGKIYNAEKFKKIFGIDTTLVNELADYMSFGNKESSFKKYDDSTFKEKFSKPKEVVIIDINTADSAQWVKLSGIGPYYATKIIKYRDKLGGFLYLEQLLESGIIKDSLYHSLHSSLKLSPGVYAKVNINTADYRTLMNHPYFTKETANSILKYRLQHGPFSDTRHIRRIKSLNEAWGNKILPYLTVDSD